MTLSPSPSLSPPLPSSSFLSDLSPSPPIFHLLAMSPLPLISFASFTSHLPHLLHLSSSLHLVLSLLTSPPLHPISLASPHFSSPSHLVSLTPCLPHASSPLHLVHPPLPSLASHLNYTPYSPCEQLLAAVVGGPHLAWLSLYAPCTRTPPHKQLLTGWGWVPSVAHACGVLVWYGCHWQCWHGIASVPIITPRHYLLWAASELVVYTPVCLWFGGVTVTWHDDRNSCGLTWQLYCSMGPSMSLCTFLSPLNSLTSLC
jgi:hypothetical protein